MPYGSYSGPDKPDKGQEGGSCNRRTCQDSPAIWYNHGSYAWYCTCCKNDLDDAWARTHWKKDFPDVDHPQFETREMMEDRGAQNLHVLR